MKIIKIEILKNILINGRKLLDLINQKEFHVEEVQENTKAKIKIK